MKNALYILISLVIFSCSKSNTSSKKQVSNKSNSQKTDFKEELNKDGNSLLWRVEGNGIENPCYIFGSLQVITAGKFNTIEKLEPFLDKCNSVVLETADEPKKGNVIDKLTFKNDSIANYLNQEDITEIADFFDKKMGINKDGFNAFFSKSKPYLVYSTIALANYKKTPQIQLMEFQKYASENNKKLTGLSSLSNTIALFDSIPNDTLYSWCLNSIRNYDYSKELILQLENIYTKQELSKILPLLEKASPEFLQYYDLFVGKRLNKWMPTIEQEIKKGETFIGIGALLISCENNILDRLKRKGYSVIPIKI